MRGAKALIILLPLSSLLAIVLSSSAHSSDDDCSWSREHYEAYVKACQGTDQCSMKAAMQRVLTQACKQSPQLSPKKEQPAPTATEQPDDSGPMPAPEPPPRSPPPDRQDYSGEPCVYFTRPSVESVNGVLRQNAYEEGSAICYKEVRYDCERGRWVRHGDCPVGRSWDKHRAELIEKSED